MIVALWEPITIIAIFAFQPPKILHASFTYFGNGSFFFSTSFSICSISLIHLSLSLSALYRNMMEWCSSSTWSIAYLPCMSVGFDTVFLLELPMCHFWILQSSTSNTLFMARYWFLQSWIHWNLYWCRFITLICTIALLCLVLRLLVPLWLQASWFNSLIESIFSLGPELVCTFYLVLRVIVTQWHQYHK